MTYYMIWPEKRFVRGAQIRSWYFDAVANKEIVPGTGASTDDMARALHNAGLITLAKEHIHV